MPSVFLRWYILFIHVLIVYTLHLFLLIFTFVEFSFYILLLRCIWLLVEDSGTDGIMRLLHD
jgi:hypothetical protein